MKLKNTNEIAIWIMGFFVSVIFLPTIKAEELKKPNIIFIMADDLAYGDLGCYGQKTVKTPHLDQLAQEGMLFEQFYAGATVCAPSRCVLMTGLHTGHCYIRGNSKANLRPDDVTVAEVLKPAGYTCGLFGKWGLGHEGSLGTPNQQGFDEFYGYLDQHHAHNYYPTFLLHNEKRVALKNVVPKEDKYGGGMATEKVEYSHDLIVNNALNFIDTHREDPFFLYLSATIPHANNEARSRGMEVPDLGEYADKEWPLARREFAAMVSRLDSDVGRLMQKLRDLQLDENTIVFFTSDNGPHREGGHDPEYFNSRGPLRGIKRALYEGGIRVPMIVRWPEKIVAGSRSNHIGYFADFLPTAAELAGVKTVSENDGISFVSALLGNTKSQQAHEYLYWEFYEQGSRQAVRFGDWKAIVQPMNSENVELYNLSTDLGEKNDLAKQHPEVAQKALAYIKQGHTPSEMWKIRGKKKRRNKK